MKKSAYALAILLAASPLAYSQTGPAGSWRPDGEPWTLVLRMGATGLRGTVSAGGLNEAEIYDVKSEGNTITFKFRSPDGDRVITFTGKIIGDEIAFTRDVQIREGGASGPVGVFGATYATEFTVRRVIENWSGTIRNAPTPRNANPNPNPRAVSLGTKKVPDLHWRWRGGEKEFLVRTFTLPMGSFELSVFELEANRLTFSFSRPNQGDEVRCDLTRRSETLFQGTCKSEGNFSVLIDLTPPAPAEKNENRVTPR